MKVGLQVRQRACVRGDEGGPASGEVAELLHRRGRDERALCGDPGPRDVEELIDRVPGVRLHSAGVVQPERRPHRRVEPFALRVDADDVGQVLTAGDEGAEEHGEDDLGIPPDLTGDVGERAPSSPAPGRPERAESSHSGDRAPTAATRRCTTITLRAYSIPYGVRFSVGKPASCPDAQR